jgi:mannosyltransferase
VNSRSISPPRLHAPAIGAARSAWLERMPLIALLLLAALLRGVTLDHQSLWYDEAVTAVRVLHPSLGATLSAVAHGENTPPLYYVLEWGWTRALGTGMFALRSSSALAGVGVVAVAWAIGRQLSSRRAAVILAALVATNPLFVWYSQEARSYELFVLLAAVALLFFLRARQEPSARNLTAWALASALALATFYFSIFLIVIEAALLLLRRAPAARPRIAIVRERGRLLAVAAVGAAGLALLPLLLQQHGRGLSWITNWPLHSPIEAIGYYYLVGESGRPLGHLVMLAALAPIAAALALVPKLAGRERAGAALCAGIGLAAIALPLLLALAGSDYLAPRYLVAAYVPLTAALALVLAARCSLAGALLAALICSANLAVYAAVLRRPQLQRGDWRSAAAVLRSGASDRALVVAAIGAAPLQYYLPSLTPLNAKATVAVREVDLVGYAPLRHGATRPPARGLRLVQRRTVHGIVVLRFRSARALRLPAQRLLEHRPVDVATEALASAGAR